MKVIHDMLSNNNHHAHHSINDHNESLDRSDTNMLRYAKSMSSQYSHGCYESLPILYSVYIRL